MESKYINNIVRRSEDINNELGEMVAEQDREKLIESWQKITIWLDEINSRMENFGDEVHMWMKVREEPEDDPANEVARDNAEAHSLG